MRVHVPVRDARDFVALELPGDLVCESLGIGVGIAYELLDGDSNLLHRDGGRNSGQTSLLQDEEELREHR